MQSDRRRFTRSPVNLTSIIKNIKTGKAHRWVTKNLNGDGLCLVADTLIERGTLLEIELKLADFPAPFMMRGQVVWVMSGGKPPDGANIELGVMFTGLPPQIKAVLNQYAVNNATPELS